MFQSIPENLLTNPIIKVDKDYLSYSTVLDIHLSDPENFSDDQRLDLIVALRDVLSQDVS